MNAGTTHSSSNLSVFLLGAVLNILAAVDYTSFIDYSVKAVLGGLIWLGFKLLGEYLTMRMKSGGKDKEGGNER